jgi:hypothetical protein
MEDNEQPHLHGPSFSAERVDRKTSAQGRLNAKKFWEKKIEKLEEEFRPEVCLALLELKQLFSQGDFFRSLWSNNFPLWYRKSSGINLFV